MGDEKLEVVLVRRKVAEHKNSVLTAPYVARLGEANDGVERSSENGEVVVILA